MNRIAFPLRHGERELIVDVCKYLLQLLEKRFPYGKDVDATIAELLNFLPEVQFMGGSIQEVSIDGHWFAFDRKPPKRPLDHCLREAEDFDSNECEIMLMRYRFRRTLEAAL